jgi:hypothetical protein
VETEDEVNPSTASCMIAAARTCSRPKPWRNGMWFPPTATELVPPEYYIPASATKSDRTAARARRAAQGSDAADHRRRLEKFVMANQHAARRQSLEIDTGAHALAHRHRPGKPPTATFRRAASPSH